MDNEADMRMPVSTMNFPHTRMPCSRSPRVAYGTRHDSHVHVRLHMHFDKTCPDQDPLQKLKLYLSTSFSIALPSPSTTTQSEPLMTLNETEPGTNGSVIMLALPDSSMCR